MKLDIAITYESVLPSRGGCETYIADLCHLLVADRHTVHLYAVKYDPEALPPQVRPHLLPAPRGPRCWRPWAFARACRAALRGQHHDVVIGLVKTLEQDVLMVQGGFHRASADANVAKHAAGWKRAAAWLVQRLNPAYWSYCWLESRQLAAGPLVVAPSHWVAGHAERYYGLEASQVRVVPNAIPEARVLATDRPRRRTALREQLGIAPTDVAALFSGHNYRLKGLEPLLRAVARTPCPQLHLLVCGNPHVAPWRRLAMKLGLQGRVHFLGFLPDMRDGYFAADLLVHPSFYDPCALVTLEALACGLPVITTRTNGAHELLPPELAAWTVATGHDVVGLARSLEQLCDPQRRVESARAARAAAAAWTMQDHYRALLAVLREAAARKRAA
jgi:UDP-glucose:(heptosyl)LPS alpha-1,3-glucosyltransferase